MNKQEFTKAAHEVGGTVYWDLATFTSPEDAVAFAQLAREAGCKCAWLGLSVEWRGHSAQDSEDAEDGSDSLQYASQEAEWAAEEREERRISWLYE